MESTAGVFLAFDAGMFVLLRMPLAVPRDRRRTAPRLLLRAAVQATRNTVGAWVRRWRVPAPIRAVLSQAVGHPARMVVLGFGAAVLLGSAMLALPFATESGDSAPLMTAVFTATSAGCVTGLVVVDTGTYWSTFGEVVILSLIHRWLHDHDAGLAARPCSSPAGYGCATGQAALQGHAGAAVAARPGRAGGEGCARRD